jgi:hypothetical protein
MLIAIVLDPCSVRANAFARQLVGCLCHAAMADPRASELAHFFVGALGWGSPRQGRLNPIDLQLFDSTPELGWSEKVSCVPVPQSLSSIESMCEEIERLPQAYGMGRFAGNYPFAATIVFVSDGDVDRVTRDPAAPSREQNAEFEREELVRLRSGVSGAERAELIAQRLRRRKEERVRVQAEAVQRKEAHAALESAPMRARHLHERGLIDCFACVLGETRECVLWHSCPWIISVCEATIQDPRALARSMLNVQREHRKLGERRDRWDSLRAFPVPFSALQRAPERLLASWP